MSLLQVLDVAYNGAGTERSQAEAQLKAFEQQNFPEFVLEVARIVGHPQLDVSARVAASLLLRNIVAGKSEEYDAPLRQRFFALPPETVEEVKANVVSALAVPSLGEHTALTAAMISRVVLAGDEPRWPVLLAYLNESFTASDDINRRTVALRTIEFTFEANKRLFLGTKRLDDCLGAETTRQLLNWVIPNVKHPNHQVQIAASQALVQSIVHLADLSSDDALRDSLVKDAILPLLASPDDSVAMAGWASVVCFTEEYYDLLTPYIQTFGELSIKSISEPSNEPRTIGALEFWITLCETELDMAATNSLTKSSSICANAARHVLPAVFSCLINAPSDQEVEPTDWTVQKMAGLCVVHLSKLLKEDVLEPCVSFVNAHFSHSEWSKREAAMLVFASIMDGPSSVALSGLIDQSFMALLNSLDDPCVHVRDSVAWAVARIAEFHPQCIFKLPVASIVERLCRTHTDQPRVVVHICAAFYHLANHCQAFAKPDNGATPLDSSFHSIVSYLNEAMGRHDARKCDVRHQAAETLSLVILRVRGISQKDTENLCLHFLQTLEQTVGFPASNADVLHAQQDYCVVLYAIIVRVGSSIKEVAGPLIPLLCQVASASGPGNARSIAAGEAVMALSAVACQMKADFMLHAPPDFIGVVASGVQERHDLAYAAKCMDLAGDWLRGMRDQMPPQHTRMITTNLLELVSGVQWRSEDGGRAALLRSLQTLSALLPALGAEAGKVLGQIEKVVGDFLLTKSDEMTNLSTFDSLAFVNSVLEALCLLYSNFLLLESSANKVSVQQVVLGLLNRCHDDNSISDNVLHAALGLAMDACGTFDTGFNKSMFNWDPFQRLLQRGLASSNAECRQLSGFLQKMNAKRARQ